MFKREVERKWLVDLKKLEDLKQHKREHIKIGYLSQEYDSLSVYVESINDSSYTLNLKDDDVKIRNIITYEISKEEFDLSIILAGNKILAKNRYYIPSDKNKDIIFSVDIFDDFGFIIAEYESDNELVVDTILDEDWFTKEITKDENFFITKLIYKK